MAHPTPTARPCGTGGTQWFTQPDPTTPVTCPGCGTLVTLKVDDWGGETYVPAHDTPSQGAYGLYVTHRTGGHLNLHPWARFATRDDAAKAARTHQAERGPARQQTLGPTSVKAYPNDVPTMTFEQWLAGGCTRPF